MTLPRRLTLIGTGRSWASNRRATSNRCAASTMHVGPTTLPANQEVVLDGVQGNAMEIVAEIDDATARRWSS